MKVHTKVRAGIIGFALAFLLLIQWLAQHPHFVETYYSNGVYPYITLIVAGLSSQFKISITELSIWVVLLILIPLYIKRIRHRKIKPGRILLNILSGLSILIVWFYLSWGINYLRLPLQNKLSLENLTLEVDAFDSTFVDVIRNTNRLNLQYAIQNFDDVNEAVEASYVNVLQELKLKKVPGPKGLKTLFNNWVLNKALTSGFFSPFFHEVHFNSDMHLIEVPFVLAHEKAHQMGYTSEAEANFLAYLVCIHSDDLLVQYSGYFNILGYFTQSANFNKEKMKTYTDLIDEGVKLDFAAVRERWRRHRGFISQISNKGYDLYLKANRVPEGRKSYSRVVALIIKFRAKEKLVDVASQN